MPRATKEQPAVKRTKAAAKPVAETKRIRQAKPSSDEEVKAKRAVSKPVDIPKQAETTKRLTPKQKNDALKLKLQQLLEEL